MRIYTLAFCIALAMTGTAPAQIGDDSTPSVTTDDNATPSGTTTPKPGTTKPKGSRTVSIVGEWKFFETCIDGREFTGDVRFDEASAASVKGEFFRTSNNLKPAIVSGRLDGRRLAFRTTFNYFGKQSNDWSGMVSSDGNRIEIDSIVGYDSAARCTATLTR